MVRTKWSTVKILTSLKSEVDIFCKKQKEFSNSTQFIGYVVRKEIENRKNQGKSERVSWSEDEIKEKLEVWIKETSKKAELEERLKKAYENSKNHTKTLSAST